MANTSYEGTAQDPFQLDHFQQVVDFNWGGFAILQVTFPSDLSYDFSIDATSTAKSYKVDDEIEKKGKDDSLPIIGVNFDEPNPVIDEGSLLTGFTFQGLFGEKPPLQLFPHVEVVDDLPLFFEEDQARWDRNVAEYNVIVQRGFDRDYSGLEQDIIDAFLTLHPNGEILRNITDLRDVDRPEPTDGWGIKHVDYLPLPWQALGGGNTLSSPGFNRDGNPMAVFSFPEYMTYHWFITNYPPFAPILYGGAYGKYPNYSDQKRNREVFIINLQKLGDRTFDLFVNSVTHHLNKEIEIVYSSGGTDKTPDQPPAPPPKPGFFAKAKRTVVSGNKDMIVKTKRVSGAIPLISLAKFDRHGFVDT